METTKIKLKKYQYFLKVNKMNLNFLVFSTIVDHKLRYHLIKKLDGRLTHYTFLADRHLKTFIESGFKSKSIPGLFKIKKTTGSIDEMGRYVMDYLAYKDWKRESSIEIFAKMMNLGD